MTEEGADYLLLTLLDEIACKNKITSISDYRKLIRERICVSNLHRDLQFARKRHTLYSSVHIVRDNRTVRHQVILEHISSSDNRNEQSSATSRWILNHILRHRSILNSDRYEQIVKRCGCVLKCWHMKQQETYCWNWMNRAMCGWAHPAPPMACIAQSKRWDCRPISGTITLKEQNVLRDSLLIIVLAGLRSRRKRLAILVHIGVPKVPHLAVGLPTLHSLVYRRNMWLHHITVPWKPGATNKTMLCKIDTMPSPDANVRNTGLWSTAPDLRLLRYLLRILNVFVFKRHGRFSRNHR